MTSLPDVLQRNDWIGNREDRWTDVLPQSWQSAINTSAAISIANRARQRGVSIPALGALTYGAIEAALNGQDTAF